MRSACIVFQLLLLLSAAGMAGAQDISTLEDLRRVDYQFLREAARWQSYDAGRRAVSAPVYSYPGRASGANLASAGRPAPAAQIGVPVPHAAPRAPSRGR